MRSRCKLIASSLEGFRHSFVSRPPSFFERGILQKQVAQHVAIIVKKNPIYPKKKNITETLNDRS